MPGIKRRIIKGEYKQMKKFNQLEKSITILEQRINELAAKKEKQISNLNSALNTNAEQIRAEKEKISLYVMENNETEYLKSTENIKELESKSNFIKAKLNNINNDKTEYTEIVSITRELLETNKSVYKICLEELEKALTEISELIENSLSDEEKSHTLMNRIKEFECFKNAQQNEEITTDDALLIGAYYRNPLYDLNGYIKGHLRFIESEKRLKL